MQKPDKYSFTALISACAEKGKSNLAARYFQKMQEPPHSVLPDEVLMTAVVSAFARARDSAGAERFFQDMLDRRISPSEKSFTALLSGYCITGDLGSAEKLLDKMVSSQYLPTTTTYNLILEACSNVRADDTGLPHARGALLSSKWFYKMARAGVTADNITFTSLIDCHAKRSNYIAAYNYLLQTPQPDSYAFCAAIRGCRNAVNVPQAKKVVDLAVREARRVSELKNGKTRLQKLDLPGILGYGTWRIQVVVVDVGICANSSASHQFLYCQILFL